MRLRTAPKLALAGRRLYERRADTALNIMIEERVEAAAASAGADEVRRICAASCNGKEIENSIPKILRANPFTPLNNMVGPNGETMGAGAHDCAAFKSRYRPCRVLPTSSNGNDAEMEEHGIGVGFLYATVSTNGFVIEPVFFTPDSLNEIHREYVEEHGARGRCRDSSPVRLRRTLPARIRADLIELFEQVGGIHMQIGKTYKLSKRPATGIVAHRRCDQGCC